MNNEIAVALFITNYISIEECDRSSRRGRKQHAGSRAG